MKLTNQIVVVIQFPLPNDSMTYIDLLYLLISVQKLNNLYMIIHLTAQNTNLQHCYEVNLEVSKWCSIFSKRHE